MVIQLERPVFPEVKSPPKKTSSHRYIDIESVCRRLAPKPGSTTVVSTNEAREIDVPVEYVGAMYEEPAKVIREAGYTHRFESERKPSKIYMGMYESHVVLFHGGDPALNRHVHMVTESKTADDGIKTELPFPKNSIYEFKPTIKIPEGTRVPLQLGRLIVHQPVKLPINFQIARLRG